MTGSVGLVIPAYRPDVDRLRRYVSDLRAAIDPAAVVVELDAPEADVESAVAALSVDVHVASRRRGKGAAITCGFEHLDTDVLAFADADGSTPAFSVAEVVDVVASGRADFGVGSRRHPDARIESHQTHLRRLLGDGFAWLARRLLDPALYDYQCGTKALTRDAWNAVREHLYEPGFAWDIELVAVAAALDQRVAEVPVTWHDRPGSTVATVETSVDLLRALVVSRHRTRRLAGNPLHVALPALSDATSLVDRVDTDLAED